MSEPIPDAEAHLTPEALSETPVFPLAGVLLLPNTIVSLHVFEPRYRRMLDDITDSHRVMAVALLDETGAPDTFGRPPIASTVGVGVVRRSARLPDGRFNLLVEGVRRASIKRELDPLPSIPYRRVEVELLSDHIRDDSAALSSAVSSLRSLCAPALGRDPEFTERLNEISDPGALADTVAAAVISDTGDRKRILEELDVIERLEIVSGVLGSLLLKSQDQMAESGWGAKGGEA